MGQAGLQFGIGDVRQLLLDRIDGTEGGQCFLHVVAVPRQVVVNGLFEQGVLVLGERFLLAQDLREPLFFRQRPGVHGGDQDIAADEFPLPGENAGEQIAITHRIRHDNFPRLLGERIQRNRRTRNSSCDEALVYAMRKQVET